MTKRTIILASCLALAGGTLGACGDDDEESAGTAPPTTAGPGNQPAADVVEVDMKDIKYVPQAAAAKVGQTVVWTNSDPVAHTVTAEAGAKFDSGTINPGKTYEVKVDKPGRIAYVCTIHPNQKGTLTVRQ